MVLSGAAAGAAGALEDLLKQRFFEQLQRQQLAQQAQRDAITAELGRGRLDNDRASLAEHTRQFNEQAPVRLAGVAHTNASTAALNRQPEEAQKTRDFTAGESDKSRTFTAGENQKGRDFQGQQGNLNRGNALRIAGMRTAGSGAQANATQDYATERTQRVRDSVTGLKDRVSPWTVGAGSLLSYIPATDARNFQADLDALKSNIAFGELAEMRAASKTGGALGSVSEKELKLLESTLGALDTGQSGANFSKNLDNIIASLDRWEHAKKGGAAPAGAASPSTAQGGPKVGDTKTFPNGSKGVWDGQGWVKQ